MTAFSISAVEAALRFWLLTATSLSETEVIWMDQGRGGEPTSGHFFALRLASLATLSPYDEVVSTFDGAAPAGSEITQTARGPRELGVYVQAHSVATSGTNSAFELVRKAQAALDLPAIALKLNKAGLACIDKGQPQNVATLFDTRFQGRYALDVRFNASDEAVAQLTYIQTVNGTGTLFRPPRPPLTLIPFTATV